MHGRYIHNVDGSTAFQPYGKEGQYINSVSRGELNKKLMDLAEQHGAEIYFNHKCENIDWQTNTITFELPDQQSSKPQTSNYFLVPTEHIQLPDFNTIYSMIGFNTVNTILISVIRN